MIWLVAEKSGGIRFIARKGKLRTHILIQPFYTCVCSKKRVHCIPFNWWNYLRAYIWTHLYRVQVSFLLMRTLWLPHIIQYYCVHFIMKNAFFKCMDTVSGHWTRSFVFKQVFLSHVLSLASNWSVISLQNTLHVGYSSNSSISTCSSRQLSTRFVCVYLKNVLKNYHNYFQHNFLR